MIKIQKDLKELIIICTKNIKGLTKKENIEKLLPIQTDNLLIQKEERKISIYKNKERLGSVWVECGCYSNLDILKIITKEYEIEVKNNSILELMKYKYKIDNMLIKENI